MKRNFNQKKGITLIALVVTIIVLLLLAGVSISMLTGQNSILKRAGQAKEKTDQSQLEEEIKLGLTETNIEKNVQGTETDIEEYLKKIDNAQVEKKQPDAWYVTKGNASATVYKNGDIVQGKVDIWDGNSSSAPAIENGNWQIRTAAELKFFADFVNNANQLTDSQKSEVASKGYKESDYIIDDNTVVNLLADIDLGARQSDGVKTYGENWIPIGKVNEFIGIFDGNDHVIRGIYEKEESRFAGLFGKSYTVKNLTIADSYIESSSNCVGGIVGYCLQGIIENCKNNNTTIIGTEYSVGGIVGQMAGDEIKDCENSGEIIGTEKVTSVAGIVGRAKKLIIKGCNNSGNITSEKGETQSLCGGIVGLLPDSSSQVISCVNNGMVTAKGIYTGGIAGGISSDSSVTFCINNGNVYSSRGYTGGIVGKLNNNGIIEDCTNTGNIKNNEEMVGGIVGLANTSSTVQDCYNTGNVTGEGNDVGGVVGFASTSSTVQDCYNTGNVTGGNYVGGVVGVAVNIVTKCYNTGTIVSKGIGGTGGIVGTCTSKPQDISLCFNAGTVQAPEDAGGISGYLGAQGSAAKETKCYNKGKVICTQSNTGRGEIIGRMASDATVTNSYYFTNETSRYGVGAIRTGGDLEAKRKGTQKTTTNLNSYEEFLTWIEQQ